MTTSVGSSYDLQFRAPLTARAAEICRNGSFIEAMQQNDGRYIGAEHLFLAIIKDPNSLPAAVLRKIGVLDQVVRETRLRLAAVGIMNNKVTGSVLGYLVQAEDGGVVVVDEQGAPVSAEDRDRRATPLWYDDDRAVWGFEGSAAEWRRRLRPGALLLHILGPELANWDWTEPENREATRGMAGHDEPEP